MLASVIRCPAAGTYLTNGTKLVLVLGPAFEGGVEIENALTGKMSVLRPLALPGWREVIPCPA